MELYKKIQTLRKERGLTQEEFANMLFVSRTAVSKWETGRGIPSIDSLQMIAKLFNISLDSLLSADEIIMVAQNENKEKMHRYVFNITAVSNMVAILSAILPLYKTQLNGVFYSVPLYGIKGWITIVFWILTALLVLTGFVQILIGKCDNPKLKGITVIISDVINIVAVLVLIISGQPYPAIMFFVVLIFKMILKVPSVTR